MKAFPSYYIPNSLTVLRLLASPLLVYLFLKDQFWLACLVFTLASLSDLLDGWIARTFNAQSDVGAILDPLADKILILVCYITLSTSDVIPSELVLLVILRDLAIVTIYFSFPTASPGGRVIPSRLSKINTVCQVGLLFIAFLMLGLPTATGSIDLRPLLTLFIWLVAFMTLLSGGGYLWDWKKRLATKKQATKKQATKKQATQN